jgi:CheY-like chemotaxis protein
VLIVEDELLIVMFLEGVLEDEGCGIIGPASFVDDALLLLERERIDAAVLDASLDGEAVSSVADALEARNVPFVFHSGYGPEHLPPRAPGGTAPSQNAAQETIRPLRHCCRAAQSLV